MLIDVHAHFYTELSNRSDWRVANQARLDAGRSIGITAHVASILGTWGAKSPTYFPSPDDVTHANDRMVGLMAEHEHVFGYCVVNPNFTDHAIAEIRGRVVQGMVGVKLAASRRANHELMDPIGCLAGELGVPMLHHVWHGRRRDWPGQEASDAVEVAELAGRHQETRFIIAHLGGGGDWAHSLRAVRDQPNIWVDLSGSGVDRDMLDQAVQHLGTQRLLWGSDLTLDNAWGKLRYLARVGLTRDELDSIAFGNALSVFPEGCLDNVRLPADSGR